MGRRKWMCHSSMRSFTALLLVGLAVRSVEAFAPVLELHNVPVSAGSVKLQPRHAVRVKPRRSRKARLASPKAVAGKQSSPHSNARRTRAHPSPPIYSQASTSRPSRDFSALASSSLPLLPSSSAAAAVKRRGLNLHSLLFTIHAEYTSPPGHTSRAGMVDGSTI